MLPTIQAELPLSIGSAPERLPNLTLYYRSTPEQAEAAALDELLRTSTELSLTGPQGNVHLGNKPAQQPLLLVAAGTGSAQAFAMLDSLYTRAAQGQPHFFLQLAAEPDDFLRHADEAHWIEQGLGVLRIADSNIGDNNRGLRWLREHAQEFCEHWILLSGAPGFVYTAADVLTEAGIELAQTHSDVYDYAPR